MPVKKFSTFHDASRSLWTDRDDPALTRRIRAVWNRAARLCPPDIPRGFRRFRSIAEANLERESWVAARVAKWRR